MTSNKNNNKNIKHPTQSTPQPTPPQNHGNTSNCRPDHLIPVHHHSCNRTNHSSQSTEDGRHHISKPRHHYGPYHHHKHPHYPHKDMTHNAAPQPKQYDASTGHHHSNKSTSKYGELLNLIEDFGQELKPAYAGSKLAQERLKKGIMHARALVRECLVEVEKNASHH